MTDETKTKTKKRFDCVEMKRDAQRRIYRELAGKTLDEELEYWRQAGKRMSARIEKNKRQAAADTVTVPGRV